MRAFAGGASFVAALGIPVEASRTFIAVMVIAFAATSLDTGARIQRLVLSELAESYGIRALSNRFVAGTLGIGAALLLALTQGGGTGGLALWPLFGTTNQLVAGVTLLILSVWLRKQGRPAVYTLVPMVLVAGMTLWAMTDALRIYLGNLEEFWLLAAIGSAVWVLDIWVLFEGVRALRTRPEATR